MRRIYNIQEAKTKLSRLADEVAAGDEVVITRDGTPIMKLVKYEVKPKKLKLGLFNGLMEPVSDEEWEQMDEEIRVKFVEDHLF